MKARKNTVKVAPYSLREKGPQPLKELQEQLPGFRIARGLGADARATIDPTPCPHCGHKVEWALTYKRSGPDLTEFTPYVYARCRRAARSHRWDFRHWEPTTAPAEKIPAPPIPAPRPSVGINSWIDERMNALLLEVKRLQQLKEIAAPVIFPSPRPSFPA